MNDNTVLVSEVFLSIDGEAYHAGKPSVFFRTVGCNLRCSWCDSKYTFVADENSKYMDPLEALDAVERCSKNGLVKHVTITGGEPLLPVNRTFMLAFVDMLLSKGYCIDIETNGAIDLTPYRDKWPFSSNVSFIMDWKCPSSGMHHRMLESNLALLGALDIVKCVVADEDFETVAEMLKKLETIKRACALPEVYISPVFGQVTMPKIPEFVIEHAEYPYLRCQLQLHKYFWEPTMRGV